MDDFLVAHAPAELRKLLDSAGQPEPVDPASMKADAGHIDTAVEAADFLESLASDGLSRLRFWRGSFVVWRKSRYRVVSDWGVRAPLIHFLNESYCKLSGNKIRDVFDQVRAQSLLSGTVEPPAWLDEPPCDWPADEILVAKNALVHLPSLVGGDHFLADLTSRLFSTIALDYEFTIDAPRPSEWLSFSSQLWPADPESIATLQDWFGYCLTPETRLQKMLLLIGPKRSGKGTIARVQRALIGPANVAGPTLASFCSNFGLWPLIDKSLAVVSDARLSGRTDQAIVVERLPKN